MPKKVFAALSLLPFLLIEGSIAAQSSDPCDLERERAEKDPRVLAIVEASSSSLYEADFRLNGEIELHPGAHGGAGQMIYFVLPEALRRAPVDFVKLGHRQDPRSTRGGDVSDHTVWDDFPAYSSVQILSGQRQDWRHYRGDWSSGSGPGLKFAEIRYAPEIEALFEWQRTGHVSVEDGGISQEPLLGCLVRVVAYGVDPVKVSSLSVKTSPRRPNHFIQQIYTPGTDFGDFDTARGRKYGGGSGYRGSYPQAVILGDYWNRHPLANGWKHDGTSIRIPLLPGMILSSVEVAVGDAHGMDEERRTYARGWAVLNVVVHRADGGTEVLVHQENVGPEGVVKAASSFQTQSVFGDYLVISAERDLAHVMAVRLGFNQPSKDKQ